MLRGTLGMALFAFIVGAVFGGVVTSFKGPSAQAQERRLDWEVLSRPEIFQRAVQSIVEANCFVYLDESEPGTGYIQCW